MRTGTGGDAASGVLEMGAGTNALAESWMTTHGCGCRDVVGVSSQVQLMTGDVAHDTPIAHKFTMLSVLVLRPQGLMPTPLSCRVWGRTLQAVQMELGGGNVNCLAAGGWGPVRCCSERRGKDLTHGSQIQGVMADVIGKTGASYDYDKVGLVITRGMVNPGGIGEGYWRVMRVGVRVQKLLPLAYPYP
ncbi:hypothetical protein EI94DRAFT_1707974 [Lactarius quietus]|nr:hypothetical protein EI94DRAFT_1707974 [Lactarius quietus]